VGVPLAPPDLEAGNLFGTRLATDGVITIVGAPIGGGGASYIYRWNGAAYALEATLVGSDTREDDRFGNAVAVDGDVAVVGARTATDDSSVPVGAAYVFRYDGIAWTEEAKLVAAEGEFGRWFGNSVAIAGNVAAVGAGYSPQASNPWSGATYLFRREGGRWVMQQRVLTTNGSAYLGTSVVLDGGRALIGLRGVSGRGVVGVYVYNGFTWVQEAELTPSLDPFEVFGRIANVPMAIAGSVLVVGGWVDALGGSVFVFRQDGAAWVEETVLGPLDGSDESFGSAVAMEGETLLVGAYGDDDDRDAGAAYLFRDGEGGWAQTGRLLAPDGNAGDNFGIAVSLRDDIVLAGASRDDDSGEDSGAVFAFDLADGDCNRNGVPDHCDIAAGTSEDRNGNGIPDECECDADLDADGSVGFTDLVLLLAEWGPCPPESCRADLDDDGSVGFTDLIALLAAWGPCRG